MKCKIPEISWHNRDPVLSVDIQPKKIENCLDKYRLASGGTDAHVLIWYMGLEADGSDIHLELAADLTRHQRAVNVVKWSPNGEYLASGDDESVIFIWKQKTETDPPNLLETTTEQDKEIWLTLKVLRGHMEDVYDLSWSPNSQFLVSGSVDNSAIIWDVLKGKSTAILKDHKGFVQGVAWDPSNKFVATLSTDRYLRIFDIQTKRVLQRINKSTLNVPDGHALRGQQMRLFHDDTLQTFFRRLCFTPDGKLLLTPSGVTDYEGCTKPLNTTYGFSRYSFKQPALILPCPDQYTVAVSCCPLLFELRPFKADINPPVVPLPYRMIVAVATRSSVYFYDTQQRQPFAVISNIHYTRLTDVTWSSDGRVVVVSSTDGFCSLITFEHEELGTTYKLMDEVLSSVVLLQTTKKSKKQKENDAPESKLRKSSTEDAENKTKSVPLEESLKRINEETSTKQADRKASELKDSVKSPKTKGLISGAVKPLLAADIILDKEILSSDEKFESPEKKSRPATPISIRRYPRTPTGNSNNSTNSRPNTPSMTTMVNTEAIKNPTLSNTKKTATPIETRRTPRAIIPTISAATINSPTLVEEAMDAWPTKIPHSPPNKDEQSLVTETKTTLMKSTLSLTETTTDHTEDIRLVYEDTIEEEEAFNSNKKVDDEVEKEQIDESKTELKTENKDSIASATKQEKCESPKQNKTPRRVELRTISTPKSKKKIL